MLKRTLLASMAGLCIAAATSSMALDLSTPTQAVNVGARSRASSLFLSAEGLAPEGAPTIPRGINASTSGAGQTDNNLREMQLYNASLIDTLLAENTPRAMTLAATTMKYGDRDSVSVAATQRELLSRAALLAPDDAWVQWIAAMSAARGETLSEPAMALQRLEPENGAVWLFSLQLARQAKDSQGITEALARIGASSKFDDYSMTSALEWLAFFRAHPTLEPFFDLDKQTRAAMPMITAISRAAAIALSNYVSPTLACKSKPLVGDRREACLAVGRLMLTQSTALDSMHTGAALLRLAGAEDAVEITRNLDYFTEEYLAVFNAAMGGSGELERYQTDWLQTRNQLEAARNLLIRAGIPLTPPPGWKSDSNRFRFEGNGRNDG